MRRLKFLIPCLLLCTGCLPLQLVDPQSQEQTTTIVPSNPFGAPIKMTLPPVQANYPKGNSKHNLRVTKVGHQLLTANPEIGIKPHFMIFGTPKCELFHTGTYMVHITEGLVDKCATDGQLAALLAHEFGEMVAEREALAHPKMRVAPENPPAEVTIGHGIGGSESDTIRLAELAKYDKQQKYKPTDPLPVPDPKELAAIYLENAGYTIDELETVQPLLKEAERTYVLEKQFKQTNQHQHWAAQPQQPKQQERPQQILPETVPEGDNAITLPETIPNNSKLSPRP